MLFSACRSGSNSEEIIEIIDNPNEPPTVPTVMITVGNDYTGAIKVNYLEKPASTSTTTKTISGTVADGAVQLASYPPRGSLIVSIQAGAETNPPIHYIGRLIGSSAISLKLKLNNLGNLELRPADSDSNKIPIGTYAEFQLINGTLGSNYKQEADIDLMGDSGLGVPDWEPIGTSTAAFTGTYDGDGKLIKRLYINADTRDNVGLFGYATGSATFTDVHIASGSVTGKIYVGGLLGYGYDNSAGAISDCSNAADITSTSYAGTCAAGGVVGSTSAIMTRCSNSGTVTGSGGRVGGVAGASYANMVLCSNSGKVENSSNRTGGVLGYMYGGYPNSTSILGCSNTGDITASGVVGGILGNGQKRVEITACYNTGNITSTTPGYMTGGILGGTYEIESMAWFYITACYNIGEVKGKTAAGGIAGLLNSTDSLNACYSTGKITGDSDIHSMVGNKENSNTTVTACYWKANGATSPSSDSTGYTEITGNFFTPPSTGEWGTGDGSESGKYWKANVDYTENLPKLWYEE
ncbi:MAG: hypothetical protein Ta2F_15320 [Termitinemataceae bacterium]|nr:MAG: hypothetical protein Ta2F_15320 [Termitinemataceae bacterium]